jgi:hypothetical protein
MRWKNRDIWLRLELAVGVAAVGVLIVANWFRQ